MTEAFRFHGDVYQIPSCWTVVLVAGTRYRRVTDHYGRSHWVRAS